MSLDAIQTKRLRRTWEPTEKAWEDNALDVPWEHLDPGLHKSTIFSLKNVFFFSHATSVQTAAIKKLRTVGTSVVMEAPTGSGKTLAFLIPLLERTLAQAEKIVQQTERPPLTRNIIGVILSPSRVLAQQSFVVARNFASRLQYNIQFQLCDGVLEKPKDVVDRLQEAARGAGVFLVTTPFDFRDFLEAYNEMKQDSSDAVKRKEGQVAKRPRVEADSTLSAKSQNSQTLQFFSSKEQRFVLVIDEADMIFRSTEMKQVICDFVDRYSYKVSMDNEKKDSDTEKNKKKKSSHKKSDTCTDALVDASHDAKDGKLWMDMFFVGATVATSTDVTKYSEAVCKSIGTKLFPIAEGTGADFVSQLQNRYAICAASDFLPYLVQMINNHPSKKHFVFFNKRETLLFAQKLFVTLSKFERPLLFIEKIYSMYEGMGDTMRLSQYNGFLTHSCSIPSEKKKTRQPEGAEVKNQHFLGGWKRDGKTAMGNGAILLCTDVAAFGLDVRDVDYVYHFEPPTSVQSYIHRIGRVGRMGMRGSSILLLPCIVEDTTLCNSRERKVTSTRFNTVTNTNMNTSGMQIPKVTTSALDEPKRAYLEELSSLSSLEECAIPSFAPISSTLRNIISADAKVTKLARSAAMAMCAKGAEENQESWYTPTLAVKSLLLD